MALTFDQIRLLRELLEQRRLVLESELRGGFERAREEVFAAVAGETPDSGERSFADYVAGLDDAEVGRDAAEWKEIQAALARLAAGTYGLCVSCGADIGFRRLGAAPEAARCLRCQQQAEGHHSGSRGPSL
jgi:DnaK suppressor protein